MPRIIHGYHVTRRSRYHIPVIIVGLLFLVVFAYLARDSQSALLSSLGINLGLSLSRLFIAYFISLIVALPIAIFMSQSSWGEGLIPVFDLLQNIPSFALIPLFAFALGYSNKMAIIFAASSILWPILFYILHGLSTARKEWNDAAAIFGATGWKRAWYYLIPLSLSALVTGSIVGFSIGWEAVIGVEIIGLGSGIGVFLNDSLKNDHRIFALALLALLLIVFILNRLVWMPLLRKTESYGE